MAQILSNQTSRLLGGRALLAVPVPTGTELIANGNMETGSPPSTWATSGTWASATDERTGGSGSKSGLLTNESAANRTAYQTVAAVNGAYYLFSGWSKRAVGTPTPQFDWVMTPRMTINNAVAAWAQKLQVVRATADSAGAVFYCRVGSTTSGDASAFDDVSLIRLTLASMFSVTVIPYTDAIIKCKATVVAGTRAGVVGWLDSKTSPANFLMASHDGTNARLTKCVGGTYTDLISAAATYVAGSYLEIRRSAGTNTFSLWWNGAKVGADQTVADTGIISNTLSGYMNTFSGNATTDFSAVAS